MRKSATKPTQTKTATHKVTTEPETFPLSESAAAPTAVAPTPTPTAVATPSAASKTSSPSKVNKSQLIREAVAQGITKPSEIVRHLLEKHGVVVNAQTVSTTKSNMTKSGGNTTPPTAPRTVKAAPQTNLDDAFSLIRELQGLIGRHGEEAVRKASELLTTRI